VSEPSNVLSCIARRLEAKAREIGGVRVLGEKAHLEPAAQQALDEAHPGLAEKDRKVQIPCWPSVGRVDVVLRRSFAAQRFRCVAELKWCGPDDDIVYEAIWDLLKMALARTRPEAPRAFLVTGAEEASWPTVFCRDLFDSKQHEPEELCARRMPSGRLAWDDLLEGGYDRFPDCVPSLIETRVVGREPVRGDDGTWELRAVEVRPAGDGRVPFREGWPFGQRPPDALRPAR
jgi:hypothetical protein